MTHLRFGLAFVFLERALVNDAVEEQNVPADCAFACINVADEHDIDVLLHPGCNGGGICPVSRF